MSSNQTNIQQLTIGTLIVHPELFNYCVLKPEYFEKPYDSLYSDISKYFLKNATVIIAELAEIPNFELDLCLHCQEASYTGDHKMFKRMQDIVIENYKKRRIAEKAIELRNGSMDSNEFDSEYQKIMSLKTKQSYDLTTEILLTSCRNDKKNIKFSKFIKLAKLMRLKENDFMVIAGATGTGKSGFALNLLDDLSRNYPCLYFNLEMVPQELHQRLISINCGLEQNHIGQYDKLSNQEMGYVNQAINSITARKIEVVDTSQTVETLRAMIASHESDRHMIVFIDHIGLIGSKAKNSYERMTEISKELRKLSLDHNCTIIGLSQLNREATKVSGKPKLSMLRDSGEIEQSASKILFVWQDDSGYSLVLEKNRSGSTGYVDIYYNKATQVITEV